MAVHKIVRGKVVSREHPPDLRRPTFDDEKLDAMVRELAHTMLMATKRSKTSDGTTFSPKAKLDTKMIDDRRKDPPIKLRKRAKVKQRRIILAKRGAFAGQNNLERPGPKAEEYRNRFAGDERLERPAPRGPDKQYVGPGDAGSRHTRRVLATRPGEVLPSTKPKKKVTRKTRPTINQGRHDA